MESKSLGGFNLSCDCLGGSNLLHGCHSKSAVITSLPKKLRGAPINPIGASSSISLESTVHSVPDCISEILSSNMSEETKQACIQRLDGIAISSDDVYRCLQQGHADVVGMTVLSLAALDSGESKKLANEITLVFPFSAMAQANMDPDLIKIAHFLKGTPVTTCKISSWQQYHTAKVGHMTCCIEFSSFQKKWENLSKDSTGLQPEQHGPALSELGQHSNAGEDVPAMNQLLIDEFSQGIADQFQRVLWSKMTTPVNC